VLLLVLPLLMPLLLQWPLDANERKR